MWKTLDITEKYKSNGRWLKVEEHKIELHDGQIIPDWTFCVQPDYINVAAVDTNGEWLIFKQNKYAIEYQLKEKETLATVGGYVDSDENPLDAAKRELFEETGYESNEWTHLASCSTDANRGCGVGHLFFAKNCTISKKARVESDDLEVQTLLKLSTNALKDALINKEFKLMSWTTCISMALMIYHNE